MATPRKKRLVLLDRSEEIYEKLPPRFRDVILNAIIARALETGELGRELSLYVRGEEAERIMKDLGTEIIKVKRPPRSKVKISREKPREEKTLQEMGGLFSY